MICEERVDFPREFGAKSNDKLVASRGSSMLTVTVSTFLSGSEQVFVKREKTAEGRSANTREDGRRAEGW